jgi:hypothetical protein
MACWCLVSVDEALEWSGSAGGMLCVVLHGFALHVELHHFKQRFS